MARSAGLTPYRVFYGHAKDAAEAAIRADVTDIRAHLSAALAATHTVEVVSGFDEWHGHFRRCGSWEAWTRDVAVGKAYGQQEPRYHAVVLGVVAPSNDDGRLVVGSATQRIADLAIGVGKPVLALLPRKEGEAIQLVRVRGCETIPGASPAENGRVLVAWSSP